MLTLNIKNFFFKHSFLFAFFFLLIYLFFSWRVNLLTIILSTPMLTVIFLFLFQKKTNNLIHKIGLYSSAFSFCITLCLFLSWNHFLSPFFVNKFSILLIPTFNFDILFGIDGIALVFILLTNLFIFLCILSLPQNQKGLAELQIYLFLIQFTVLLAFSVLDLVGFFIFFEATLIPIYFIILIWGSRERKIRASYLISLYTLFGSIFMFFSILYIYSKFGLTNYLFLNTITFSEFDQKILWISFFLAFATKIPMFPFHIWLPEAHVEAPTVGSVLLAVLLLKLGTFGILRFLLPLFPLGTLYYTPLINTFATMSILYTSLVAIRQDDLKKIIAYSSVGHMNVVLLGLLTFQMETLQGTIFQMLSHGVVSGALFFCVGSFYRRYKVRSLSYLGGCIRTYPLLCLIFLTFSLANISFPGTSSFIGESLIFLGLMTENTILVFFSALSMITGSIYTLWSFGRIAFGNIKESIYKAKDLERIEFYLYTILVYFLFLLGLFPNSILNIFEYECALIMEQAKIQLMLL